MLSNNNILKIVHLSKYYPPYQGGIESVVRDLASETVNKNINVSVIASDVHNQNAHEIIDSVIVFRSKEYFNLAGFSISPRYLFHVIKNNKKDVIFHIHLPNPLANLCLFLCSAIYGIKTKIVVHWHSDIIKQNFLLKFYQPFVNWLLKKADVIIVTSENYLEHSVQLSGYKDKCVIIPIGVEDKKSNKKKLTPPIYGRYIFALGRHIYYKGFEVLIEAVSILKKNNSDVKVIIGGVGPDTSSYKRLIDFYGLNEHIFLVGKIKSVDLESYYSNALAFCLPSIEKSEAFGVVQIESMSYGTPVISTNILGSGVSWVNKHGESGLVCEVKSAVSLADAINSLASNELLRSRLASGARKRYLNEFTLNKMVSKVLSLYKNI